MATVGERDPRPYSDEFGLPFVGPELEAPKVTEGDPPLRVDPLQGFRDSLGSFRASLLESELGGDLAFTVGGHLQLRPWYGVSAVNSGNKDAGKPSRRHVGTNPMTPVDKGKGKAALETSSATNTTINEPSGEGRQVPPRYPAPLCDTTASSQRGSPSVAGPSSSTSANKRDPVTPSTSSNNRPVRLGMPPSPSVTRRAEELYNAMVNDPQPSTTANPTQNSSEAEAEAEAELVVNDPVVSPEREPSPPAAPNPPNPPQQPNNAVRVSSNSPPNNLPGREPEEWAGETAVTIRWDSSLSNTGDLFKSPLFETSGRIVFPPCKDDRTTPEDQIALLTQDMTPTVFGYELLPGSFSTSFSPHESGIIDLITQSLLGTWSTPGDYPCPRPEGRSIEVFLKKLEVHCPDFVRNKDGRFRDEKVQERLSKPQVSTSWEGGFGELVVTLPFVPFEGGVLSIYPPRPSDNNNPVVYDRVTLFTVEKSSESESSESVEEGSPGGSKKKEVPVFNVHWAAWHDGCRASVSPVTQGYRVSLVYDLMRVRGNPLMGSTLTARRLIDPSTTLPLYRLLTDILTTEAVWEPEGGYLGFMLVNAYPHGSRGAAEIGFKPEVSLRGVDFLMYHMITEVLKNYEDPAGSRPNPLAVEFRPVIRDAQVEKGAKKHVIEVQVRKFVEKKKREKARWLAEEKRKEEERKRLEEQERERQRLEEEEKRREEEERQRLEQARLAKEEQERLARKEQERAAEEEQRRRNKSKGRSRGRGGRQAKSKATAKSKGKGKQNQVVESEDEVEEGEEEAPAVPAEERRRSSLKPAPVGSPCGNNAPARRSTRRVSFADEITELGPAQQNPAAGTEKAKTTGASNANADDRQKENVRPTSSTTPESPIPPRRTLPPVPRFTGDEPGESSRAAAQSHQLDPVPAQFGTLTQQFTADERGASSQTQHHSMLALDEWVQLAQSVPKTNEMLGLMTQSSLPQPQPANVNPQNPAPPAAAATENASEVDWVCDYFPPTIGKNYKRAVIKAWPHASNDPAEMKDLLDAWSGKSSADQGTGTTNTANGYYIDFRDVHWLNQWGHEEVSLVNTMYTAKGPGPRLLKSCLAMIIKVPPGGIMPCKAENRRMWGASYMEGEQGDGQDNDREEDGEGGDGYDDTGSDDDEPRSPKGLFDAATQTEGDDEVHMNAAGPGDIIDLRDAESDGSAIRTGAAAPRPAVANIPQTQAKRNIDPARNAGNVREPHTTTQLRPPTLPEPASEPIVRPTNRTGVRGKSKGKNVANTPNGSDSAAQLAREAAYKKSPKKPWGK